MKILGLDPGTTKTGFAIYDDLNHKVLSAGVWDNEMILNEFMATGTFDEVQFDECACEWIESFGMAVGKSTFETVWWIGRYYQRVNHTRVTRKEVKLAMCNSLRAKDSNIRRAILDRFGKTGGGKTPEVGTTKQPGPLFAVSSHAWSALAVALTYSDHKKEEMR